MSREEPLICSYDNRNDCASGTRHAPMGYVSLPASQPRMGFEYLATGGAPSNDSSSFCFAFWPNDSLLPGLTYLPARSFEAKERLNILTARRRDANERY